MTLAAAILFLSLPSLTLVDGGSLAQSTPPSDSSTTATQQQTSPSQTTPASSGQTGSAKTTTGRPKPQAAKKSQGKKNAPSSADCDATPANTGSGGSTSGKTPPQPGNEEVTPQSETPKNCPPTKIVVHQGGITEQSIQLAGGTPGDDSKKREAVNQMLAATQENLKKAAGQLSVTEQSSVSQIRQFVDQSKKALSADDVERAQTLAWKAKLLSDDLVKPRN